MRPQEVVERALELSRADGCVVHVVERSETNLRWANSTITTNGEMRSRRIAVVSVVNGASGSATGTAEHTSVTADSLEELVRASERIAAANSAADDAAPLVEPADGQPGAAAWSDDPAVTTVDVFAGVTPALGEAFARSRAAGQQLFGFAEHVVESVYLGSSTGLRLHHDQPGGTVELNAKSLDRSRSAWVGLGTTDFTDVDVTALDAGLVRRLEWASRRVDLPAGRYETILPPAAVADLMTLGYAFGTARDADEGRSWFARPGGGTRVGERIATLPLTLRSNPFEPGLGCAPFVHTPSSGLSGSVFDNGLPTTPTAWISDGVLRELVRTRSWAARTGAEPAPMVDNLVLEQPGADAAEADLVAATGRGLLLTCFTYVRLVDPQTLLFTGLTRDGVYLVEGGEVVGAVNNFRFNESPMSLLERATEVGRPERCIGRDINEYFPRTVMPALRIPDFNMSTVSQAS
ncbi:MAG TPA: metallopeptidase TldD-related protein [Pseudonocardiaceae bacterium]